MAELSEMAQSFRFSGGIETKEDPKTVPFVKLLALENGVFAKATSIKKRNGYEVVATVDGGRRLATRDNELIAFTSNRGWSVSAEGLLNDTGAIYSTVGADRPLVVTGTQQTMPDQATLDDVTVVAWEDSQGGVWWSVIGEVSGRVYRAPAQADSTGRSPRCVPAGTNLHIYYAVPAQRRIMVIVVDPTAPTAAVTPSILVDDLDSTQSIYDACPTTRTGTPTAVAWFEHGSTNIRVGYVDQSGIIGSPLTGHPSAFTVPAARAATSPLAVMFGALADSNHDRLVIAFVASSLNGTVVSLAGGDVTAAVPISSLGTIVIYASTSVTRVAAGLTINANGLQIVTAAWEESAAAASNRLIKSLSVTLNDASLTAISTLRSVGLASRAFVIGRDVFAAVVHDTTFFNVYQTVKLSGAESDGYVYAGRHVPGGAAGAPTRQHLSSVHVSGSIASFALPFRQRLVSENNDKFTETSLRLFALDFDNEASHQYAQLGRGLYLAGGCPHHYDGRTWAELGFNVGPELIVTVTAGGGSMTSSTTYLYRCWYEATDAQGEVHRGPESNGTLVTMGGSDTQVTLTLPTCRLTRRSNVRIMVARSAAADTGDTAELRRVTSLDPTTAGTANGYVANSTTVDTVTFIDRMSDTTLATFDEIYTDGGILSNDPAPLGAPLARGKQRLLGLDPSDGSLIRYSQPIDDGYGVEWPPDLQQRVDPIGGDITAIAVRDDRAIAWKESAIWTFAGDGPALDGTTDRTGFSASQLVPGDVGCTEPASIVLIPSGFLFKSGKGIYLLGNDFTPRYIGAPVEAFNDQTIRRATVLPNRTQVVFLTDSGSTLLYDYLFDQWSTFTNHEGLDAAVVSDQFYYLRADGRIFRETIGAYSDAGIRIRLLLDTAWVHMQQHLQGFDKFFEMYLIGTWISAHQLGVQYQLDYMTQWTDPVWLDATGLSSSTGWITGTNANTIGVEPISGSNYGDGQYGDGEYGGSQPGIYEWRLDLYEKGNAIQFRFQDFEADGFSGASFELTELTLTGAAIGYVRRPMTAGRSA
jgi:hypothetical protein